MTSPLRTDLIERLRAAGDPERAEGQQAYMKSAQPYHGVRMPEVRKIATAVVKAHPLATREELESTVLDVWRRATHREQRYAATELAIHTPHRKWLDEYHRRVRRTLSPLLGVDDRRWLKEACRPL